MEPLNSAIANDCHQAIRFTERLGFKPVRLVLGYDKAQKLAELVHSHPGHPYYYNPPRIYGMPVPISASLPETVTYRSALKIPDEYMGLPVHVVPTLATVLALPDNDFTALFFDRLNP